MVKTVTLKLAHGLNGVEKLQFKLQLSLHLVQYELSEKGQRAFSFAMREEYTPTDIKMPRS